MSLLFTSRMQFFFGPNVAPDLCPLYPIPTTDDIWLLSYSDNVAPDQHMHPRGLSWEIYCPLIKQPYFTDKQTV